MVFKKKQIKSPSYLGDRNKLKKYRSNDGVKHKTNDTALMEYIDTLIDCKTPFVKIFGSLKSPLPKKKG